MDNGDSLIIKLRAMSTALLIQVLHTFCLPCFLYSPLPKKAHASLAIIKIFATNLEAWDLFSTLLIHIG